MSSILVVNAGSTSLKLHLVAEDERVEKLERLEAADAAAIDGVAHRVVHGGARFRDPVLIDAGVSGEIRRLEALAPLHNAPALEGIERAQSRLPGVPHVAVFDTAFHATIPDEASAYALPERWRGEWGIRRFGFHGLSVAWSSERAPALLRRGSGGLRLIVCHLGGGSSVTAVRDGRSVDTTMGFSPLEGVPMTTRAGSIDPGVLLYVLRERGLDLEAADRELNLESGLKGLSGLTGMEEIETAAAEGDAAAELALAVYALRVAQAVASMATSAGGLDALVFTAGIGENSALVRERVCARLAFLGVELDPRANDAAEPDRDVAAGTSPARVLVIRAREELVAARGARALLGARA